MLRERAFFFSSLLSILLVWPGGAALAQHNCDFAAVIAGRDYLIPEISDGLAHPHFPITFDCPEDFFYDFIIQCDYNPNGYGIVYSRDGETLIPLSQTAYSTLPYSSHPGPLDEMHDAIMDPASGAAMVMAHDRTGTGGAGNHPFRLTWKGTTYCFMHNGYIPNSLKQALWWELYHDWPGAPGSWFVEFPSNWVDPGQVGNYALFIDSEIVFHWIMKQVILTDGSMLAGLYHALTAEIDNPCGQFDLLTLFNQTGSYKLNFVLCD